MHVMYVMPSLVALTPVQAVTAMSVLSHMAASSGLSAILTSPSTFTHLRVSVPGTVESLFHLLASLCSFPWLLWSWQPVTPCLFIAKEKRGVSVSKENCLVCVISRNGFISIELKPTWEGRARTTQLRVVHINVHMHECGGKVNLGVVPQSHPACLFRLDFSWDQTLAG